MTVEPTIFELSRANRRGVTFPVAKVPDFPVPSMLAREDLAGPEVSEIDVVRHFQQAGTHAVGKTR